MLRRDYLSREEINLLMVSLAYSQMLEGLRRLDGRVTEPVWKEWDKRGMITPSMKKNIKSANTYIKKFSNELISYLSDKEREKVIKKNAKFDFKLIDDYTMQKIFRDMKDALNYVHAGRKEFTDVLEEVAGVHCVGCSKHHSECKLYDLLQDVLSDGPCECENCCYAVDLSGFSNEERERYNKRIESLKSKNMFISGGK